MSALSQQRCRNHAHREAVARCPECQRFYCRECVTEHEDRVVCASCLRALVSGSTRRRWRVGFLAQTAQLVAGVFIIWVSFYMLGRFLLNVPSDFHAQSVWAASPADADE